MKVYLVGEDMVTCSILKTILDYCSPYFEIISELPARGGEIKTRIPEFNKLSEAFPVILLIDLDDANCAPELLDKLIPNKNTNFIFNIAVDEAEAWLMADREGFAHYFDIDLEFMPHAHPTKHGGPKALTEMDFNYKPSMFLSNELIQRSRNPVLIKQLTPKTGAKKGPEYNSVLVPFIESQWNIDRAKSNSDSLQRMISRINNL